MVGCSSWQSLNHEALMRSYNILPSLLSESGVFGEDLWLFPILIWMISGVSWLPSLIKTYFLNEVAWCYIGFFWVDRGDFLTWGMCKVFYKGFAASRGLTRRILFMVLEKDSFIFFGLSFGPQLELWVSTESLLEFKDEKLDMLCFNDSLSNFCKRLSLLFATWSLTYYLWFWLA